MTMLNSTLSHLTLMPSFSTWLRDHNPYKPISDRDGNSSEFPCSRYTCASLFRDFYKCNKPKHIAYSNFSGYFDISKPDYLVTHARS